MVKLSELRTADEIHEQDMRDPEYRQEYERTKFANDVAIKVLAYRTQRGMSQTEFGRMIGMKQPHVARLEAGDHEPSLSTLAKLSAATGQDFSVDIKPNRVKLRHQVSEGLQAVVRERSIPQSARVGVAAKAARSGKATRASAARARTATGARKSTGGRKVATGAKSQGRKRS